jgi:MFS family permease
MGGINALNYYFSIILEQNLGMSELMARVLTGVNATSYCISTALAFWIIERAGRRVLMLSGLCLQGFAYVMVAIAVGLLATAPQQVIMFDKCHLMKERALIKSSGAPWPLRSCSSTTQHLAVHGAWSVYDNLRPHSV